MSPRLRWETRSTRPRVELESESSVNVGQSDGIIIKAGCHKRFWVERRPKESCPARGGELHETEERRRAVKAGFATQKECQAAMNKLLVATRRLRRLPRSQQWRRPLTSSWSHFANES